MLQGFASKFGLANETFDIWPSFDSVNLLGDPSWDANTYADWIAGIDNRFVTELGFDRYDLGACSDNTNHVYAYEAGNLNGPMLFLIAGIHGEEVSGQQGPMRWAEAFQASPTSLMAELRERWHLLFIPTLNPFGYRSARVNANDVDVNRNFPWAWDAFEPESEYQGKGTEPFSEVETRMVRDAFDVDGIVVDCHNFGVTPKQVQVVGHSLGTGVPNDLVDAALDAWNAKYHGLLSAYSYLVAGQARYGEEIPNVVSWAASVSGNAAMTVEIDLNAAGGATGQFRAYMSRLAVQAYCGMITEFVVASTEEMGLA